MQHAGADLSIIPGQLDKFVPSLASTYPTPAAIHSNRIAARLIGGSCQAFFCDGHQVLSACLDLQDEVCVGEGKEGVLTPAPAKVSIGTACLPLKKARVTDPFHSIFNLGCCSFHHVQQQMQNGAPINCHLTIRYRQEWQHFLQETQAASTKKVSCIACTGIIITQISQQAKTGWALSTAMGRWRCSSCQKAWLHLAWMMPALNPLLHALCSHHPTFQVKRVAGQA
jgi:hypothetical protein